MTDERTDDGQPKAGDVLGYCDCPICLAMGKETVATVILNKRGKKYFKCPVHDVQLMTNNNCQQWLHENMRDTPQRTAPVTPAVVRAAEAVVVEKLADPADRQPVKKKRVGMGDALKDW